MIDYYSRFVEMARLTRTTAEEVINHMKSVFARHGIPEHVMSDNGPQFTVAFISDSLLNMGLTSLPAVLCHHRVTARLRERYRRLNRY